MIKKISIATTLACASASCAADTQTIRIATFNVSMEALNYVPYKRGVTPSVKGDELINALNSDHQQIKNIAEIIQRVQPDILLLNEFDGGPMNKGALKLFQQAYLEVSQNKQNIAEYKYSYQGDVNTGVLLKNDSNGDGKVSRPSDTHGFGYFPGHFGMALLSKYPIDVDAVRTFQMFKWKDMPNALKPFDPETNKPWYSDKAWNEMRLSSKSHWDIPVSVAGKQVHVLASHPTPPVFDGKEDRNGKRNHDELKFWGDYITEGKSDYIYDDTGIKGGLGNSVPFVFLGDLNASTTDGDAIVEGIASITKHDNVLDTVPSSKAAKLHSPDNKNGASHTAHWRMRADYVLPSKSGWEVVDSGVFWPQESEETYRLIKNRQASSDHRLVWVDLKISK